jgi:UDP-N-acetylglucosamine 2-epimerase (non-hydrolysing)
MKVLLVAGARPNFMKVAPILAALRKDSRFEPLLVHTGQHYDAGMSDVFFQDLGMPEPDLHLGVGSGSHAEQTARVMTAVEPVLLERRPDLVMVVGDVNSTLAASLVAAKLGIPVAHVEAGLRSFDRTMPEELNRMLTDQLSDLLLTTSADAEENLLREGIEASKIHFVGNVMIDSLLRHRKEAAKSKVLAQLSLAPRKYAALTLHRPANVDDRATFDRILTALEELAAETPILFPVHPRTRKRIEEHGFGPRIAAAKRIRLVEPLGYLDFLRVLDQAALVLTDSGGIQEETTVLGVPCLTLRENTERPVTITRGTNVLVGLSTGRIVNEGRKALAHFPENGRVPEKWDGKAAERIVAVLLAWGAR